MKQILSMTLMGMIFGLNAQALEIDMSKRQIDFSKVADEDRLPIKKNTDSTFQFIEKVFEDTEPQQEIVILNTEKGFVPAQVRLRKGGNYKLHVVNVNPKQKNVSFVLDAFSEHHATSYGVEKTFTVAPKTEGIFSFQCPETAVQGKLIVTSVAPSSDRKPASASEKGSGFFTER